MIASPAVTSTRPSPEPWPYRLRPIVAAAAVVVVALAAYSDALGVPLQYDDPRFLLDPAVASVRAFLAAPHRAARVVTLFTFALDGSLHGGSLAGLHATNLAIHVATALCVLALTTLACRTVEPSSPGLREAAPWAGLAAALLFVAHPVQTEAVTYLVQRLASLSTLLYVGAVLAYAHAVLSPSRSRRAALFSLAAALGLLALFAKESAVTLPAALAAFDLAVLPGTGRERLRRLVPYAVLVAVPALAMLDAGRAVEITSSEFRSAATAPGVPNWLTHLVTQPGAVLEYLRLLAWPSGQSVDPPLPLLSRLAVSAAAAPAAGAPLLARIASLRVLGPAAALLGVIGVPAWLAWRARLRSGLARLVLLAVAWFAIGLSVECVLPLADPLAEHRIYLPSIGIFLVAGAAAAWLAAVVPVARRAWIAAAIATVVLALGGATWARNRVWRTPRSLWSDALEKAPENPRPYVFVAQELMRAGEPSRALELLARAAKIPNAPLHVALNQGAALTQLGDLAAAERIFRDLLDQGAAQLGAHRGLAQVLVLTGRTGEACEHVTAGLQYEPHDPTLQDFDANCRFARGDVAGAAAAWEQLAARRPEDGRLLYNLAFARATLGDVGAARAAYGRFLAVAGSDLDVERRAAAEWLAGHPATGSGSAR